MEKEEIEKFMKIMPVTDDMIRERVKNLTKEQREYLASKNFMTDVCLEINVDCTDCVFRKYSDCRMTLMNILNDVNEEEKTNAGVDSKGENELIKNDYDFDKSIKDLENLKNDPDIINDNVCQNINNVIEILKAVKNDYNL